MPLVLKKAEDGTYKIIDGRARCYVAQTTLTKRTFINAYVIE